MNIKEAFVIQKQFIDSRLPLSEKNLNAILTLQNGISEREGHATSYIRGGVQNPLRGGYSQVHKLPSLLRTM